MEKSIKYWNYILIFLLLIVISFFLKDWIVSLWYQCIGIPIFGQITACLLYDWVSIGGFIVFIMFCLSHKHHIAKWFWKFTMLYALIYIEFRIIEVDGLDLVPFHLVSDVYYADLVPIGLVIFGLTARRKSEETRIDKTYSQSKYFEDKTDVSDLLGHKAQAETLSNLIKSDYANSNNAVGIAVTGEWGAGKSTFLGYMKAELSDCTIIEFDPWTENSTNVVSDLLNRIENGISKQDNKTGIAFRNYLSSINVTNVTGWFGLFLLSLRNFFTYESETEQKKTLTNALHNFITPIVVLIDDSDRLPADQFLKTISIIRGIADLPNVVFVVAFDQTRTNDKLRQYGGDDFMRKLFNVIHPLQAIDEKIIIHELVENISSIIYEELKDASKDVAHNMLANISIKKYLPTLREVKRFSNVIEKDYSILKKSESFNFIDLRQWLTLELLKYFDIASYKMIASSPTLYLDIDEPFSLNSPYYVLKNEAKFGKEESMSLLYSLFGHQFGLEMDTLLISNPKYFPLYFNDEFPEKYIPYTVIKEYSIVTSDTLESSKLKAEALKTLIHNYWHNAKDSNIDSVVCEILKSYPVELLYPILEQIILECSKNRNIKTFKELGENDNYRKYLSLVKARPYVTVLSFVRMEEFCEFGEHGAANDECILKSENPLILCAIFNNQIRNWDYDGRICSDGYLFDILKRLVKDGNHQDVVWVVADCNSAELQESFLDDYIQNHLLDCLPYILRSKESTETGDKLIYADIPAFEGLFLSYEKFKSTTSRLIWNKNYDEGLITEIQRLVSLSNFIGTREEYFKADSYPKLKTYLSKEQTVFSEAHIMSETFWSDGDRIEDVNKYILT